MYNLDANFSYIYKVILIVVVTFETTLDGSSPPSQFPVAMYLMFRDTTNNIDDIWLELCIYVMSLCFV